jgi:hypothetical protein
MGLQVIFATAFERLVFKVSPSPLSMLGTLVIMGCAVYIAVCRLLLEIDWVCWS